MRDQFNLHSRLFKRLSKSKIKMIIKNLEVYNFRYFVSLCNSSRLTENNSNENNNNLLIINIASTAKAIFYLNKTQINVQLRFSRK